MTLPRFEYLNPSTLADALSMAGGESVFVAGGTDLFVRMKERITAPKRVIGLGNIAGLRSAEHLPDGGLRIGAAITLTDLAETLADRPQWRGLKNAIELTSSPLLRNAGTVGGNLCQEGRCYYYNQPPIFRKRWPLCFKLGGDRCHVIKGSDVCHAVYSGDLAGPLMAMKATVTIAGPGGTKKIEVGDFFTGSGLRPVRLAADEILTEIGIPKPPLSCGFSYQKLRLRDTIDYPLLGISLFLEFDPEAKVRRCLEARLVLNAAGPVPLVVPEVGQLLSGQVLTEKQAAEVGQVVRKMAHPVANTASTPRYRREMVEVLTRRAFQQALDQAGK